MNPFFKVDGRISWAFENTLPENSNCQPFAFRFTQFPGQKNLRPNFQESVTTDAVDGFSKFFGTRGGPTRTKAENPSVNK